MSTTSYLNGNKIIYNNMQWFYEDGKLAIDSCSCPYCGKLPTSEGYDACLGKLPGVKNACCGHGITDGYIQFENDVVIRFTNIINIKEEGII